MSKKHSSRFFRGYFGYHVRTQKGPQGGRGELSGGTSGESAVVVEASASAPEETGRARPGRHPHRPSQKTQMATRELFPRGVVGR